MASSIDDNAADEKSGKGYSWLFIIHCTSIADNKKICLRYAQADKVLAILNYQEEFDQEQC